MSGADQNIFSQRELIVMSISRLNEHGHKPLAIAQMLGAEVEFVDQVLSQIKLIDALAPEPAEIRAA